jgi:hypothetical protein
MSIPKHDEIYFPVLSRLKKNIVLNTKNLKSYHEK